MAEHSDGNAALLSSPKVLGEGRLGSVIFVEEEVAARLLFRLRPEFAVVQWKGG